MTVNRHLRILMVEDHETVRQGLKLLIDRETDLEVVEERVERQRSNPAG